MIPFETAPTLHGVSHGFFGRLGGVSTGDMASLNCGLGSGDDPAAIAENRHRVRDAIAPEAKMASLYQVHGNRCVIIDQGSDLSGRPEADAMVTATPGILLSILTADCVPVLLWDSQARVIGAAHAGWKGALAGITDSSLAAMETLGAKRDNILAALGPCIGRASYEVDEIFVEKFLAADPANEKFFQAHKSDHAMFDIEGYVAARLAKSGIKRITISGTDTYSDDDNYFSYRRASHRKENNYGRQISVISL